jgi:hypothetical protein
MTITPIGAEDGGQDGLAAWSAQLARTAAARVGGIAPPTDNLVQMHQQGMQRDAPTAPAGGASPATGSSPPPANPPPAPGTPVPTSAADRARPAGLLNAPMVTVSADAGARPSSPGWAGPGAGAAPGGVVGTSTDNVSVLVTAPRTDGLVRDAPGLAQLRAGLALGAIGIVAVATSSASGDAGLDEPEEDEDRDDDRQRGRDDAAPAGPGRAWGGSSREPGARGGRVDLSG